MRQDEGHAVAERRGTEPALAVSRVSADILLAFCAASMLLALTPGPNMSLILANTLTHGLWAGLITLGGTSTGLSLLVAGAALGLSSLMVWVVDWFDWLRTLGALYLVYLGARQLWRLRVKRTPAAAGKSTRACGNWYVQGLLVSLSNPKVLLFLGAFLPQFLTPGADLVGQLVLLSVLFVAVLVTVDVCYTLIAARARRAFAAARLRLLEGAAGVMLLLGGLALALVRRP